MYVHVTIVIIATIFFFRVQQHLMVRNSCTVLLSVTEAVLDDRSWHMAGPMSSSLWPEGRPPSNMPQVPLLFRGGV